jgi:phytoene dehydrogenase-like protein
MTTAETYDVVVVGGGHNALIAAAQLAEAGVSVVVLEGNAVAGGAMASGEPVLPGHVHDLYAMNHNQFLGSWAWSHFGERLRAKGVSFATSDLPFATSFPDGTALRVHQGLAGTLTELSAHHPGDAEGFARLFDCFTRFGPVLTDLYGQEMPSIGAARVALRAVRRHGLTRCADAVSTMLLSTRSLGERFFATPQSRTMTACWGMHADYAPDVSGGALFPLLAMCSDVVHGMSVVRGGAGQLAQGLQSIVEDLSGRVELSCRAVAIEVTDHRAHAVQCVDGRTFRANTAILAGLHPHALAALLDAGGRGGAADGADALTDFTPGPGTMMLHLVLDGPIPWAAGGDLADFAYVHVGPSVDDIAATYQQALAGLLPANPMLVVGQPTSLDPTRAPAGRHVVWIQVRAVPSRVMGDATGAIVGTSWTDLARPMADRVMDILEQHAPGLRERVIGRHVVTPDDLARANPNLVGGDSISGSHHLDQLLFRPARGWNRYRTPVRGLYVTGASTWPGAGVNGTSGHLAATRILRDCARGAHGGRAAWPTPVGGLSRLAARTGWDNSFRKPTTREGVIR